MKKLIFLFMIFASISKADGTNNETNPDEYYNNKYDTRSLEIFKKCENPLPDIALSDMEIKEYINTENECLVQEIINLIKINIPHEDAQKECIEGIQQIKDTYYAIFYIAANYSKHCQTSEHPLRFDCGTYGKNLVAPASLQSALKMIIDDLITTYEPFPK